MRHILLALALMLPLSAYGATVSEAPQEARVRALSAQLRCPVCQSENILDSQAGTAKEMVVLLREKIAEGLSDEEIYTFFQTRYGNYVLLSPPAKGAGGVIWMLPLLMALGGFAIFGVVLRRHKKQSAAQLPQETEALTKERLERMGL